MPNAALKSDEATEVCADVVRVYYDVLSDSDNAPDQLAQLYRADSLLSLSFSSKSFAKQCAQGPQAILRLYNATISNAGSCIKHMDAQWSLNGGALVHTTGFFHLEDVSIPFFQSFVLGKDKNGFYIRNHLTKLNIGANILQPVIDLFRKYEAFDTDQARVVLEDAPYSTTPSMAANLTIPTPMTSEIIDEPSKPPTPPLITSPRTLQALPADTVPAAKPQQANPAQVGQPMVQTNIRVAEQAQPAAAHTHVPAKPAAVPIPSAPPKATQAPPAAASAAAGASANEPVKPASPTPAAPPRAMLAVSENARPDAKPVQTSAAPAQAAKTAQAVSAPPPEKPVTAAAQAAQTQAAPTTRHGSATHGQQPSNKAPASTAPAATHTKAAAPNQSGNANPDYAGRKKSAPQTCSKTSAVAAPAAAQAKAAGPFQQNPAHTQPAAVQKTSTPVEKPSIQVPPETWATRMQNPKGHGSGPATTQCTPVVQQQPYDQAWPALAPAPASLTHGKATQKKQSTGQKKHSTQGTATNKDVKPQVSAQVTAAPVGRPTQPSPGAVFGGALSTTSVNAEPPRHITAPTRQATTTNQSNKDPKQAISYNQGHCVLVKNLPKEHVRHEQLEAEFSKFGPLFKRGPGYAITIQTLQGGGKGAFVQFEDAKGAAAACAGHVSILGRVVEVVKHEGVFPTPQHRGQGRGGYRGRGGNYRG